MKRTLINFINENIVLINEIFKNIVLINETLITLFKRSIHVVFVL